MVEVGDQELPGGFQYADDTLFMSMQGATQWDALSHAFYDGVMWNGRTVSDVISDAGTTANSVTSFRDGVVGRGVLLDVARHLDVDCLADDQAISPETARRGRRGPRRPSCRPATSCWSAPGASGRAVRERSFPLESFTMASPGLSVRCADWLVRNEVAAVAADNVAVEVTSSEAEGAMMPLHMICQRDAGIIFGELFDLEELATALVARSRWEFLLVAAPLPVTGAVGVAGQPARDPLTRRRALSAQRSARTITSGQIDSARGACRWPAGATRSPGPVANDSTPSHHAVSARRSSSRASAVPGQMWGPMPKPRWSRRFGPIGIERVGVVEHGVVAIGGADAEHHDVAFVQLLVAQLDSPSQTPAHEELGRRVEPERLLDGWLDERPVGSDRW